MSEDAWLHRLATVLPGQAPLGDFVHHNTLHGLQHLPFPQALRVYRELTGTSGYLPLSRFRDFLKEGRITAAELNQALRATPGLDCDAPLTTPDPLTTATPAPLTKGAVYQASLRADFSPLTAAQLAWQMEEGPAAWGFFPEISATTKRHLREKSPGKSEAVIVSELWQACLDALEINPEQSIPPESESVGDFAPEIHAKPFREKLFARVGQDLTLGGLVRVLTGVDIPGLYRPNLIRHLAGFLDQGVCAWPLPLRAEGLYPAWKNSARYDLTAATESLHAFRDYLATWPDSAPAAINQAFDLLGIPAPEKEHREGYLTRLALDLPGWAGMILWLQMNPEYPGLTPRNINIQDYFAISLILERFYARQICASWFQEPSLDALRGYFAHRPGEFLGRFYLFNHALPDYLATPIQQLLHSWSGESLDFERNWQGIAAQILELNPSPLDFNDLVGNATAHQHGWPLFRLAQHLGLSAAEIRAGGRDFAAALLTTAASLDVDTMGDIWLRAYEQHYQSQIFHLLAQVTTPPAPIKNPAAQLIFCMDDREEGFRRHLEALNPQLETFGAAGFFGIPMNWQGLDDSHLTRSCPVGAIPIHTVREEPAPDTATAINRHRRQRIFWITLHKWLFQHGNRGLFAPLLISIGTAPLALAALLAKLFAPLRLAQTVQGWEIPVATRLNIRSANDTTHDAAPADLAARVAGFLRTIGLTRDFAPLVVLMGHGSESQNNPHFSAYNCGACSGRHGGPNARVFAALANRPEIRKLLPTHGITLDDSCWFLGAEHNTASEEISWYDLDLLPDTHQNVWAHLVENLNVAQRKSAQERCAKFAAAPHRPTVIQAIRHVKSRPVDFSQARPELGHVTNATAIIGRRAISKGLFFDRRVYLISYDPMQDADGRIVEGILLSAGPVGAGINLEYYFSTVNNERFGCSSKVMHNLSGFLGVMEGANSDLRTGLPRQMIEIHEPMRLLVIVEQHPEILSIIYHRQPLLQELVGNSWIHLAAKDPETGNLFRFDPKSGWK